MIKIIGFLCPPMSVRFLLNVQIEVKVSVDNVF